MLRDKRISRDPMLTQGPRRARLVKPHQPAVADHVSRKDGGEAASGSHHPSQPALRSPSRKWA
jgi:hypothetical protein